MYSYGKFRSAKTHILACFMQILIEDDLLVYSRIPNKRNLRPYPPSTRLFFLRNFATRLR